MSLGVLMFQERNSRHGWFVFQVESGMRTIYELRPLSRDIVVDWIDCPNPCLDHVLFSSAASSDGTMTVMVYG